VVKYIIYVFLYVDGCQCNLYVEYSASNIFDQYIEYCTVESSLCCFSVLFQFISVKTNILNIGSEI